MNEIISKQFAYGEHTISFESGKIAPQAHASVWTKVGKMVVLTTVVYDLEKDGFLMVDTRAPSAASGNIPGGYNKTEGRPTKFESLLSRIVDRTVRALLPNDFNKEIQVISKIQSNDEQIEAEIPVLLSAAAAISISGLPVASNFAATKIGLLNNKFIVNPSISELSKSDLNLLVSATNDCVVMIEAAANEISDEKMSDAISFAQEQIIMMLANINEFAALHNKEKFVIPETAENITNLRDRVKNNQNFMDNILRCYDIAGKTERKVALKKVKTDFYDEIIANDDSIDRSDLVAIVSNVERDLVRRNLLQKDKRIGERGFDVVRSLSSELSLLPSAHGSALFNRGETQALVTATLGAESDAQYIDYLGTKHCEKFMLHYEFPPYSVRECRSVGSQGRREIGHGNLARRAILPVLPNREDFPYTIRVFSEITSSNGSSSMATVCGASLALMDAGVPIKKPVAGIAMGLVKDEHKYVILTDILGDEDSIGDMDFKVAGTKDGINALQMDNKSAGISSAIMREALSQARNAIDHILDHMHGTISNPRDSLAENAPRIFTLTILPEQIKDVIGKGGATIKGMIEKYGVHSIDIDETGLVKIFAPNEESALNVKTLIQQMTMPVEIGSRYTGKVVRVLEFGAFINFLPGKDGFIHISQLGKRGINIHDVIREGQELNVCVEEIDRQGRIKLSIIKEKSE